MSRDRNVYKILLYFMFFLIGVSASPDGRELNTSALATEKTEHYTVALLIRSLVDADGNLSPGVQAIVDLAQKRVEEINKPYGNTLGGLNGVPLNLKIINDQADESRTQYFVDETLKDPSLIAFYGLVSPTKGTQAIKAIAKHRVPFITEISDDSLFKDFSNIFSMKTSASDDIRAYSHFIADNYRNTIFIGGEDDPNTKRFSDALTHFDDKVELLSTHWLPRKSDPEYATEIAAVIEDIKEEKPEIISLSANIARNADILKQLALSGIETPVFFVNGSIDRAKYTLGNLIYFGEMFELGRTIPDIVSGKLAELLRQPGFDQLKTLKRREAKRALAYLDILSLIKEAAASSDKKMNPSQMRNYLGSRLLSYRPTKRVFQGVSDNWSFTQSRSKSQLTLVKWWIKGSDNPIIWKKQYKPVENGVIQIPVTYFSIDMVRILGVDSNHKSFNAEFYASVASHQNIGLDRFEFANAVRGEDDGKPLVRFRQIDGNPQAVHSRGKRRLYKVAGRFRFDPDLELYPFDRQPFSISLQARDSTLPVFIQPPTPALRDKNISIEGWTLLEGKDDSYVGFDTNIVSLANNHVSTQEVIHFYNYSYTWLAKRQTVNYYLRVVVPLVLILLVAYVSIFVPHARIDSVIAIQVTALLATIALYFSIPKFDSETATLSDKIFVFTEAVIVLMILSSIFRSMMNVRESVWLTRSIVVFQAILVPVLSLAMLRYIIIVNKNASEVFYGKPLKDIFYLLVGYS